LSCEVMFRSMELRRFMRDMDVFGFVPLPLIHG
jgi:hypothetical protein